MRRMLFVLLGVAALAAPAAASAKTTLVSVTSPASAGSYATLTVNVSKPATCIINVFSAAGSSHASGLSPKHSVNGVVTWTWVVDANTARGKWPIYVYCDSGALQTSLVVR
jgi:hypothetical protein